MTRAGAEIGVASTKAFTTQLAGLLMLVASVGHCRGNLSAAAEAELVKALQALPLRIKESLALAKQIETLAEEFADKHHSLFLGRGSQYPIAMEGRSSSKRSPYIHAEAYAAGELKHGPLALIDAEMPIIVVAPNNDLLEKLKSNVEEVRARGGILYVFADADAGFKSDETMRVMCLNHVEEVIAPIVYTVPLQLLSTTSPPHQRVQTWISRARWSRRPGGHYDAAGDALGDRLVAVARIRLVGDLIEVEVHGSLADAEDGGDLPGGLALAGPEQAFLLPIRQLGQVFHQVWPGLDEGQGPS